MTEIKTLSGPLFARMVKCGAVNLKRNAGIVNDLNVFPIPDGDTGDNMSRTIEGGIGAETGSLCEVSRSVADGMLLTARGNSGVILSQFFAGFAAGVAGTDAADLSGVKAGFAAGVKQAYAAVSRPVEGTILTVLREAAAAAQSVADDGTLAAYLTAYRTAMYRSLEQTPEKLPVLREAGVVDSGGAGFTYILEGMLAALTGESLPAPAAGTTAVSGAADSAAIDADAFGPDSEMSFGYCTEVLLQLQNAKTDVEAFSTADLTVFLESVGESVVAVKSGSRVKLHVHTFTPEVVLAHCRTYGEFLRIKIENMALQHNESQVVNRFVVPTAPEQQERKPIAVVAVAGGIGVKQAFYQFGADYVVDGQQTMNPSAADFLAAFEAVNADEILVLPNNGNVILTARQAADLYAAARVTVVPSATLAEGYAALTMLDLSGGDVAAIAATLQEAIDGTTTGAVTYAVRDCTCGGFAVKKGDWLGFAGKQLLAVESDKTAAACRLLERMDLADKEVVIAIAGADASAEDMDVLRDAAAKTLQGQEYYEVDGGQAVYSFLFAVE